MKKPKKRENGDLTGFAVFSTWFPMNKKFFPQVFHACGKPVEILDTDAASLAAAQVAEKKKGNPQSEGWLSTSLEAYPRVFHVVFHI